MTNGTLLLILLVLPFLGSLAAVILPTDARGVNAGLAGGVALVALVITLWLFPGVEAGGVIRSEVAWMPSLGLGLSLRMDGLAWLFAFLVTGIGLLVVIYARYYMSREDPVARFFAFFLAFMGSMLGVVLSGNLIQIVFFWELTSLFSFLLIGYWHHNVAARDGARMALTVTGLGGLALLGGMLVLGNIVGSYDLDAVLAAGARVQAHPLYTTALVLILLGALTKSAQFPFHFWLPQAMAAPTPVSAYLHSATMVKAGVFLLARLWPTLAETETWFWIVCSSGLVTLLVGAWVAIFQQDLKGLLAYSTISHLGLITLLFGLGSPLGAIAATFHILNHATFKASLFMAAGIIDHETGTRDMRRLSGLFRFMPITATLAMVAAAAMAGVPLLNGFISKEMFFAEAVEFHQGSWLDRSLPYAATLAGAFSVAYSIGFVHRVFFGPAPTDVPREPHEPPRLMRFPVEFLVVACLVVGVVPALVAGGVLDAAARAVVGRELPPYSLSVWHGFNEPLLMSILALVGGAVLYLVLKNKLARGEDGPPLLRRVDSTRLFERILVTVSWRWARTLEAVLETRRLQPQLRLIVGLALLAGLAPIAAHGLGSRQDWPLDLDAPFALLWSVGMVCAIGAAYMAKYHRLASLVLLGGAGLVTCLTFVWLSAPDLAITQLLVEVVTTVLILLGLRWLPKRVRGHDGEAGESFTARYRRGRDLALAIASGLGTGIVAFAVMNRPLTDSIAAFFLERAYSEGGGTNVVNVILVDFRGFDTLGEIVVLGAVSLTVFALLLRFRPAADSLELPEQQRIQNAFDEAAEHRRPGDTIADYLLVPSVIMRLMFPLIATLAVYLFLRGHDLPGGGFAAGVAMSIGFILQYMAGGTRWVEARLRIRPVRWIAFGLLVSTLTGAGSWLAGYPFLTSYFRYADIPVIGQVPVASALLFDLGVFALVVGSTVLMLIAIGHQSLRKARPAPVPDDAELGSGV
ncbi:cation:proton antiporter [Aureimonas sp. Leaf454]|uniref:monovalent cation/H+ antiporter subunit A n=1 Tax=Aureimonas sp. Leaf454 TaxID=1736381 RepID=UPI0006FF70CB|nr:monovalent cation/H+ antiporter subunit A [Aureimonas sp. Leaf454]KQT47589.1 cation:proton antiporter [Aureimonas sp. Leaf454]